MKVNAFLCLTFLLLCPFDLHPNAFAQETKSSANTMADTEEAEDDDEETPLVEQATVVTPPVAAAAPPDYTIAKFFPDGPFSVLLPGKPQREKVTRLPFEQPTVKYVYKDKTGVFEISYSEVQGNWKGEAVKLADDSNRLYDYVELSDAYVKHASVKDSNLDFQGYKARQCEITYSTEKTQPASKLVEKRLLLLAGSRFYAIGCTGPTDWVNSPDIEKFFGSFSLRSTRDQNAPSSVHWAPQMHTRDTVAYMKPLLLEQERKKREALAAAEAATYNMPVPPLKYVAQFPHTVHIVKQVGAGESDERCVVFETRAPVTEVLAFYSAKLTGNFWTIHKSAPGTIVATLIPPHQKPYLGSFSYPCFQISIATRGKTSTGSDVAIEWRQKWTNGFSSGSLNNLPNFPPRQNFNFPNSNSSPFNPFK